MSMFCRSTSPLLTCLDIFKARPCPPDRSDPQWSKDCHTQQHNNDTTQISCPVLPHWCNSKKKELVYLIHNTYTSPKVQASLPSNSREQSESSFGFFLSVSLSNSPAKEAQLSVRRSGRLLTRLNSLLPNFSSSKILLLLPQNSPPDLFLSRTPFISSRSFFSGMLPDRHFIIAAPTQIITLEPPSSLHSIATVQQNLPTKTPHTYQMVLPMQM